MISFIVPVFYKDIDSYIVKRAKDLINIFKEKRNVELVIADASNLNVLKSKEYNITIVDIETNNSKVFSPASIRNKAVKYAKGNYLFFFDVDLAFNDLFFDDLFNEIEKKLESEKNKFLMIPCFYLTKSGTIFYENSNNKTKVINQFRKSLMLGDNEHVERLAVNTSAIVLEKKYFIEIGMFSSEFYGHGGEDFELLHRLVSLSPHSIQNKSEYYIDEVSQFPANYKGFRKYMAYYSLPYIFTNIVLVHKWHPRKLFNTFYLRRVNNESLLMQKMIQHDKKSYFCDKELWSNVKENKNYQAFIIECMNKYGFSYPKYIGLFKYNENVKIIKKSISGKIRKLITRPRKFFNDINFKKYFQK